MRTSKPGLSTFTASEWYSPKPAAGGESNVSGFRFDGERLTELRGSRQQLGAGSDPAQIAFAPNGRTLLVSDRADAIHIVPLDEAFSAMRP